MSERQKERERKRGREKVREREVNQCGKRFKGCVREKEKGKWAREVEIKDRRGREQMNSDRKCGKLRTKSIGLVDS